VEWQKSADILDFYNLSTPYLVFLVGTPEPRKNLVRTVTAVRKAAPELKLALIGPQAPLRELLDENLHNLVFTDIVQEDHLPILLRGATISLYPSLYEGFGLPVLESMACGVPVITSNRGALPEVTGGAAVLVDPEDVDNMADAISALLDDEGQRSRLKDMGKKRSAEFSWRKTATETLALYRELF
jgi:alpha-1,3-rhamnosyl/mannosyltransferase